MKRGRKRSPRQEYRLKQRARIEESPLMTKMFPWLKGLEVTLDFFDPTGTTRNSGMKCKLNLEHAKSVVWFACPAVECLEGDFDLSEALAQAVAARREVASGELRCQGTRKRGNREPVACRTLLRYELTSLHSVPASTSALTSICELVDILFGNFIFAWGKVTGLSRQVGQFTENLPSLASVARGPESERIASRRRCFSFAVTNSLIH